MWELGSDSDRPEWQNVETPFGTDLLGVVQTAEGPYAIGDGGIIAANRDQDEDWEIVTDDGPNVSQNQQLAIDVTDDGKRIWFAGSSGTIGAYDVTQRRKYDYSYPNEMTSTFEAIAVAGKTGSEKLLVANGSGEILPVKIDGYDVNWGVPDKPGERGSTISALGAAPDGYGYAVDTSGNVFKTTKDEGWKDIGIINAQVKFYDVWAGENQRVYVAAGNGRLYRYDDSYHSWTPIGVADAQVSLRAFDKHNDQLVALGDSGNIYQRIDAGKRWEKLHTPTSNRLYDVVLGKPDIAVGKSGTVIRRPRGKTRQEGKSADGDNYEGVGETYDSDSNDPGEKDSDGSSSDGSSSDGSSSDGSTSDGSSSG